ncbi:MAG TPA: XrtA-associated tyrosine autokinase [Burkholderiales bacterium]|nr:XrtA-associated tyrosine autokinase [Burkholderiales bacterium]
MSTIERVGELLEPIEPSVPRNFPVDAEGIKRSPIDAAVQPRWRDDEEPRSQDTTTSKHSGESGKSSPLLEISREHLHRQSMVTPDGERTQNSESFRRIKQQILLNISKSKAGPLSNIVLVTSAMPGEGKTFCAVNLAISIALEMNKTVLLVDADVAKPSVPRALGFKAGRGLLDVLVDSSIDLADVLYKTDVGKLTILTAGTPNPRATELLASDAMRKLIHELAERYQDRVIIFDSPPLLAASEAGVLASQVGQIIMVVEAGKTSELTLKTALGRIESNTLTSLLLNKGSGPAGDYYGAYA